ncbi:MAG: FadR family transcriptional regulator [Chloroflexi bacterium]|nr:FadR family transcriptional regulator [Chloroflexota bacterium]
MSPEKSSYLDVLAKDLARGADFVRQPLHQQIADKLEAMIKENGLEPGSQLPSEYDLAKALKVSRVTVHQGMLVLAEKGLVQIKAGSGVYVTDMPLSVVTDTIERYVTFGGLSHDDLIAFREIIEPESAALAALHATPEDIHLLKELVDEMVSAFKEGRISDCAKADTAFHEALAAASHNPLIYANLSALQKIVLNAIYAQIKTYLPEEGILAHRPIYQAIVDHNADQARQAMRDHMGNTRTQLLKTATNLPSDLES